MKTLVKKYVQRLHRRFPRIMNPFFDLVALVRKRAEDVTHDIFYRHGFHLLRKHYYLPIPDEDDGNEAFLKKPSELVGLDMNDACALDFLDNLFPKYNEEFRKLFPIHESGDPERFHLMNGSYMAVDAHVYYALIRHFKPRRIIEIGAGRSTQVAVAAGKANALETGVSPAVTVIEPFPSEFLRALVPELSALVENKVQQVGLDIFTSLGAGDILFIDSTHALREGGDVQYEYLEILPRLGPGALVHIHDVSLPKPYPRVYFETRLYWNEQYLLQAFLAFNSRFEILWPGNYMMLKYPEKVLGVFPEFNIMRESYPMSEPTAFWMRVRDQGGKEPI